MESLKRGVASARGAWGPSRVRALAARSRMAGSTLISTMVGMALGMICIVVMMSVFQTMAKANATAGSAASSDGAIAAGMLAAQIELQKAGSGVEASTNSCVGASLPGPSATANVDFVLISGAALSGGGALSGTAAAIGSAANASGNAIVWRWMEGVVSTCEGLFASAGGVTLLAPVACGSASAEWSTIAWQSSSLVSSGMIRSFPADPNDAANPFTQTAFFKAISGSSCSPFGKAAGASSTMLTFGAGNTFTAGASVASMCLRNVCK